MTHTASFLPSSAALRAARKGTDYIWTTAAPANVGHLSSCCEPVEASDVKFKALASLLLKQPCLKDLIISWWGERKVAYSLLDYKPVLWMRCTIIFFSFLVVCLSVIPPCLKTELIHFPLRMRDWLKNVLLQLYEQDFLTAKQRSRVCILEKIKSPNELI